MDKYLEVNRKSWNQKTAVHIDSDFYENQSFLEGRNTLKEIELPLLGDLKEKKVLHLQCHFGQDSISLAKMGANVTAVDLSDEAIRKATEFAEKTETDCTFVCCDLYSLPLHLDEKFDIVFSSYGTICWLPDMEKWADIVSQYLKPGGSFVFAEFHPAVWMYDDDFTKISYNYFNAGPIEETESGTYADREAGISPAFVCWNHPLSEVIQALLKSGLTLEEFHEFDYSPWNCFNGTKEIEKGKFQIESIGNKLPMVYSLKMKKES